MTPMRNQFCVLLAVLPLPVLAQAPSYMAPDADIFIALENPYRMYWLRGTDTVGTPVRELTLERQSWTRQGNTFQVLVHQQTLDARRRATSDTLVVERDGRISTLNGKQPGVNSRIDFLLHLPTNHLAIGVSWADTLNSSGAGVGGPHRYRVERTYRVASELDTLGHHVERVTATGTVAYQDGWWVDSTKGTFYSIDVTGPVTETFLFDARAGQLVSRSWKMDLRGAGVIPNNTGGQETVRAGLISEETQALLDPRIATVVDRRLPQGDTSLTLDKGVLFIHTVHHAGDTIEAGFGRNGGLVGTARVLFANGFPASYRATWTDGFAAPQIDIVERRDDALMVSHAGKDTLVSIPTGAWGIADYAMQELLVPVILSIPADGAPHGITIYRPFAAHWDSGAIVVRPVADARIAILQMTGDKKPQALLITNDGDYLYGENSDPIGAERVPSLGSSRRAKLEGLLKRIRGQ